MTKKYKIATISNSISRRKGMEDMLGPTFKGLMFVLILWIVSLLLGVTLGYFFNIYALVGTTALCWFIYKKIIVKDKSGEWDFAFYTPTCLISMWIAAIIFRIADLSPTFSDPITHNFLRFLRESFLR